jgi:hypothetical protein
MKVRVVVELEAGASPVTDAISYFVARNGLTDADDRRSTPEWIEAVIIDGIQGSLDDIGIQGGARWALLRTTVSETI